MSAEERELRLLPVVTGIFVTVLVLTPALGSKFIAIGPFGVPGATVIFPIAFIFNDVLTEVYGYERSRRVIWTGLACQLLAGILFWQSVPLANRPGARTLVAQPAAVR